MNFLQVDRVLISAARKQRQAHLFATAQSQHNFLDMLSGPDPQHRQAEECLEQMLRQEGSEVSSACRSAYLEQFHQGRISKQQLSHAVQIIIQFGMRFDLLDQTILQAIAFLEAYLAKNRNVMNCFMAEIAIIAIELAIKINEDRVLSLEECVNMIDNIGANPLLNTSSFTDQSQVATRQGGQNGVSGATNGQPDPDHSGNTSSSISSNRSGEKFNVQMFAALERHMLLMLGFRINIPTALDFALFFAHRAFAEKDAQVLVQNCIPWMYYVGLNYDVGRGVPPSVVALTSLCYVIQASEAYHDIEIRDSLLDGLLEKEDLMRQTEALLNLFHCELQLYQLVSPSSYEAQSFTSSPQSNDENLAPRQGAAQQDYRQNPHYSAQIGGGLIVTKGPWAFPASQGENRTNEEWADFGGGQSASPELDLQDNGTEDIAVMASQEHTDHPQQEHQQPRSLLRVPSVEIITEEEYVRDTMEPLHSQTLIGCTDENDLHTYYPSQDLACLNDDPFLEDADLDDDDDDDDLDEDYQDGCQRGTINQMHLPLQPLQTHPHHPQQPVCLSLLTTAQPTEHMQMLSSCYNSTTLNTAENMQVPAMVHPAFQSNHHMQHPQPPSMEFCSSRNPIRFLQYPQPQHLQHEMMLLQQQQQQQQYPFAHTVLDETKQQQQSYFAAAAGGRPPLLVAGHDGIDFRAGAVSAHYTQQHCHESPRSFFSSV